MIDRGRSRGWTNKTKSRLSIVDRGGSWCWPYKVESSLGIVVWGWSRSRANKVQGRLCIVDWGRSNRGGNECKLSILVCLPLGRSLNLNLSLATPGSSSNNSLLLSQPVQLVLCIITTSSCKRSYRWSNVCKLSVLECLPFWGSYNRHMLSSREGNTGQRYNLGEHTELYDHFCYQTGEYSPCHGVGLVVTPCLTT